MHTSTYVLEMLQAVVLCENARVKLAAEEKKKREGLESGVERGGVISRSVASTLGRVNTFATGAPLLLTWDMLRDPQNNEQEHAKFFKRLQAARPQELGDVKMRLGGTNTIDDMNRIWHNPRIGVLGKLHGTAMTPLINMTTPLTRSTHYNPYTNVTNVFADNKGIVGHELGHAIDFNGDAATTVKRNPLGHIATKRDLYTAGTMIPGSSLFYELRANRRSGEAINDAYRNSPKQLTALKDERTRLLPAAYGSYVGDAVNKFIPGTSQYAPLIGMGVGRAGGELTLAVRRYLDKRRHETRETKHVGGNLATA